MRSPSDELRREALRDSVDGRGRRRSCGAAAERMVAARSARAASRVGSGIGRAQAASARGQRGANGQPAGSASSDGVEPGICAQVAARRGARRAASRAGRAYRGGAGRAARAAVGPSSTMRPAYITSDAVGERGDGREIVGDPDQRRAELAHQAAHLGEDLRLDRDVERGRRLVGDDQRPAGAAARSRSRRAGACRRRTGADRRRAAAPRPGCRRASAPSTARARARALLDRRSCASSASAHLRRRCVSTGLSVIIGSWNTMAMRSPADARAARSAAGRRAPARRAGSSRATIRPGGSTRPRSEKPVTLLPEPDSPTSPSTSPRARSKRHAVDRLHHAGAGEEMRREIAPADLEQLARSSLAASD